MLSTRWVFSVVEVGMMVGWKRVLVGAGMLCLGWTAGAQAQTCKVDGDCDKGFTCEITANGVCATSPPCPEGQACPPPPVCDPQPLRECRPGPCTRDADCASDMVCHTERIQSCSGGAVPPCAPGSACPIPPPPVCEEHVSQTCLPRYLLPCASASDCGEGFSCEDEESCSCAGSSGTAPTPTPGPMLPAADAGSGDGAFAPPLDGGQAPSPPADPLPRDAGKPAPDQDAGMAVVAKDAGAPSCECHSSGVKSCRLEEIACDTDRDCPARFSCQLLPTTALPTPACDLPAGRDAGNCSSAPRLPVPEIRNCLPPYFATAVGRGDSAANSGDPVAPPMAPVDAPRPGTPGSAAADAGVETEEAPQHAEACHVSAPGRANGSSAWLLLLGTAIGLTLVRRRRG
jgi:hypothetical protein